MRSLIFILALALITSCRSHKELQQDKSLAVDSIARSEHHRTIAVIDSAIRNIDFSFDTLAVKGRVIDRRRVHRDSVEAFNRLDTVAYRQSAAETSTEHSATTRLYNPPDGTAVLVIALVIAGILFYVFYRKR